MLVFGRWEDRDGRIARAVFVRTNGRHKDPEELDTSERGSGMGGELRLDESIGIVS